MRDLDSSWLPRLIEPVTQISAEARPHRPRVAADDESLLGILLAVRGRLRWLVAAEGVLWIAASLAVVAAIGMFLDWWFDWSKGLRAFALVGNGLLALGVAWRKWGRPWLAIPGLDGLALRIERRRPELRSRLISALQLGREEAGTRESAAFIRRLVADARRAAEALDPRELAPASALRGCLRRVGPVLGGLAIGFLVGWPATGTLLRRACLDDVPVPRKTRLIEVTGDRTVGRGDDLVIEAVVEGWIPRVGRLQIRQESGRVQALTLDPDRSGRGRFARPLANLPGSFRYRVRVNDAESPEFEVRVLPRPVVTNLAMVQNLPTYTGLAPREVAPGGLELLRGSRLQVRGVASRSLRRASMRLGGLDEVVEAMVDESDRRRFAASLPADDPRWSSLIVDLEDDEGIGSRDPASYAVSVIGDKPPQVRMILPARREELATAAGTVLISFEVTDDFGLGALRLRHQWVGDNREVGAVVELDLAGETNAVVRRRFEWRLADLRPPVPEGGMVEFWIEAADRNDLDGPGVGRSERYLLRIVSEAEKRADLLGRAGDAISRLSDVAQGQDRLNEALGRIILEKPPNR